MGGSSYVLTACTSNETTFKKTNIYSVPKEGSDDDDDIFEENISITLNVNDWVAVKYDGKHYPGKITEIHENELEVSMMHQSSNETNFKWSQNEDKFIMM